MSPFLSTSICQSKLKITRFLFTSTLLSFVNMVALATFEESNLLEEIHVPHLFKTETEKIADEVLGLLGKLAMKNSNPTPAIGQKAELSSSEDTSLVTTESAGEGDVVNNGNIFEMLGKSVDMLKRVYSDQETAEEEEQTAHSALQRESSLHRFLKEGEIEDNKEKMEHEDVSEDKEAGEWQVANEEEEFQDDIQSGDIEVDMDGLALQRKLATEAPASDFPPFPPFPPASPAPQFQVLLTCCQGKPDGQYADIVNSPFCSFYCTCVNGTQTESAQCARGLLFSDEDGSCNIAESVTCNGTRAIPLPPPSNLTTGLDLNATLALARVSKYEKLSDGFRYGSLEEDSLPKEVDWSYLFGDVRDQGNCSGCWAYSTVDAIQASLLISLGLDSTSYGGADLSVEQLLTCSGQYDTCQGGWHEDALEYASIVGSLQLEGSGVEGECNSTNEEGVLASKRVIGWERVPANDPTALQKAVSAQPVVVGISTEGNLKEWDSDVIYNGSFLGASCTLDLINHNVLLVGYGEGYWLARNSWGPRWGTKGYIKIGRGSNQDAGICNILSLPPVYPVVSPQKYDTTPSSTNQRRRSLLQFTQPANLPYIADLANDLAYKKPAFQSSEYADFPSPAYLAVDGKTGYGAFFLGSLTHTDIKGTQDPYLYVDLGTSKAIGIVQVYNRLDCCGERMNGVQVWVGSSSVAPNAEGNTQCSPNAPPYEYASTSEGSGSPFNTTCSLSGRYVWVTLPGSNRILTLAEVAVFPPAPSNATCPPGSASLCGSGKCYVDTSSKLGFGCTCGEGYASVELLGLPSCVLVDVCGSMSSSPCGVGECINDGSGGYTCKCPPSFLQDVDSNNRITCTSGNEYAFSNGNNTVTVPQDQSCASFASSQGLSFDTFLFLNPGVDCNNFGGKTAVVGPVSSSGSSKCATLYQLSSVNDTCDTVKALFGLSSETFATLNPEICPTPSSCTCELRKPVCVEFGLKTAVGYPCSDFGYIQENDTCQTLIAREGLSSRALFRMNPGLDCDKLTIGSPYCSAPFSPEPSVVTADTSRRRSLLVAGRKCPCKHGCFTVRKGHTCSNLANSLYHCSMKILQFWNGKARRGFVCRNKNLFPGKTTLCLPRVVGGCGKR